MLVVGRLSDVGDVGAGLCMVVGGLCTLFGGWLVVGRPAFIGLTYGLGVVCADVARVRRVSKLGSPARVGLANGKPSGSAPKLSDLKDARAKTSSRTWSASSV